MFLFRKINYIDESDNSNDALQLTLGGPST